jgi:hypothetical protein
LNDVDDIIIGGGVVVCPLQFPLGKLPTMPSIIEKQGSGWDHINEKTFFNQSEGNQHEGIVMSASKEYEECFIMFSMVNFIKKQSRTKINETKPRLNVYLRFSVPWITLKSVMIHFEEDTRECSKTATSIFVRQMT